MPSTVPQKLKLLLGTLTSHTEVQVGVLSTPFPVQLLASVSEKATAHGTSTHTHKTHVGDPRGR